MPIVIRLNRKLVERKMTLTQLAERVGITVANLSILKTGKAKAVRLETLESICRELDCQPGDLLEYVADDPGQEKPKPGAARRLRATNDPPPMPARCARPHGCSGEAGQEVGGADRVDFAGEVGTAGPNGRQVVCGQPGR